MLWAVGHEALVMPIWNDRQHLEAPVEAGDTVIPVDTVFYDFDPGSFVVFWRAPDLCEAVEIESLTETEITLSEPVEGDWPTGTRIYPGKLCRIEPGPRGGQIAHDVRRYGIIVSIDEGAPSLNRVSAITPDQYRDVDIFPTPTEASEDLSLDYEPNWNEIDFDTGIVGIDSGASNRSDLVIPYRQIFASRQEIAEWLGFLDRRRGSSEPFWTPSWEHDFVPVAALGGILGHIDYEANGFADLIGVEDGRKDIVITAERATILHDPGDQVYRRITAATEVSPGVERINTYMADFAADEYDKIRVSFARYCRLNTSTIELFWLTNCYAQCLTSFRELRNVPNVP